MSKKYEVDYTLRGYVEVVAENEVDARRKVEAMEQAYLGEIARDFTFDGAKEV